MNEYLIKIKGTQGLDGDCDTIEFSTYGDMIFSEDLVTLNYCEGEMLGVKNVKTRLTLSENKAIMEREGELNSRLVIEKNVRNDCIYSLPQGDITLGIYGEEIKNGLNSSGGKVYLSYKIDSNFQPISQNTVEIEVKKAK